ncbi:MAG: hypothetical protein ACIAXF_08190 [Phycisphaerales bacterium JB063]
MKSIITKALIAGVACVGVAGFASADTAPFNIVSGASHSGVDLSVTVQASDMAGYDFEFVINNNSTANGAAITGIYIESGWATSGLLSDSAFERNLNTSDVAGSGVNFIEGSADPNVAGWTDSLVSYEVGMTSAGMAAVWLGVDEGESATIAFAAGNSGVTLEDLEAALGASGFNIGVRLQDLFVTDNYVEGFALASFDSNGTLPPDTGNNGDNGDGGATGVPTPTAAAAGLALLGIAGFRRRRDA